MIFEKHPNFVFIPRILLASSLRILIKIVHNFQHLYYIDKTIYVLTIFSFPFPFNNCWNGPTGTKSIKYLLFRISIFISIPERSW
jgi:hypothetical protein